MTDEESMIISALRYALPRRSYIMSVTEDYIRKFIEKGVSENFLRVVKDDIEDHYKEIKRMRYDTALTHDWKPLLEYVKGLTN